VEAADARAEPADFQPEPADARAEPGDRRVEAADARAEPGDHKVEPADAGGVAPGPVAAPARSGTAASEEGSPAADNRRPRLTAKPPAPPPPRPEGAVRRAEPALRVDAPVAAAAAAALDGDGAKAPATDQGLGPKVGAVALGTFAAEGARQIASGARALVGRSRAKRQQLALAPVRLGTLSPRQLNRRAENLNIRRIGKLEPGFKPWRRLWSLVVLIVIVAVIAVAVAAVLDLIVTALSVAANHAISKSAGS
jgi:hypothetical protein